MLPLLAGSVTTGSQLAALLLRRHYPGPSWMRGQGWPRSTTKTPVLPLPPPLLANPGPRRFLSRSSLAVGAAVRVAAPLSRFVLLRPWSQQPGSFGSAHHPHHVAS